MLEDLSDPAQGHEAPLLLPSQLPRGTTAHRDELAPQIRKYAVRSLARETKGQIELAEACKTFPNWPSQRSGEIELTNAALGAAIEIARGWLDSKNGNEVMAAKSLLNKHELDFEPEDPREKRYQVKMPKSLSYAFSCYRRDGEALRPTPEVEAECTGCVAGR